MKKKKKKKLFFCVFLRCPAGAAVTCTYGDL